ncbi:MAG: transglutaminase family protein [Pseudomonadota bacterium]
MLLNIDHKIQYHYDGNLDLVALNIRLFPSQFALQNIVSWRLHVNGCQIKNIARAPFGNQHALWISRDEKNTLEIIAKGEIRTRDHAGVLSGFKDYTQSAVFLRQTKLTRVSEEVLDFVSSPNAKDPLDIMHGLSEKIHQTFEFNDEQKNSDLTATQILQQDKGNAQDYAHLFVAAARALNYPARCVIGYLCSSEKDNDKAQNNKNSLHTWAEAKVPSIGWVGFDSVYNMCPTDRYIRLTCGLDVSDAAILRTHITGAQWQENTDVIISELEEEGEV